MSRAGVTDVPKAGYKHITINNETYARFKMASEHYDMSIRKLLERILLESQELRDFADKIEKVPKTVRNYT